MRVGITQRVVNNVDYFERRDALDQRWTTFLEFLSIDFVIIPNALSSVTDYVNRLQIDGFILSGGNDLVEYGGNAIERDKLEKQIIELAVNKKMPILGVCRGMQLINEFFGGNLCKVENQVKKTLKIKYKEKDVHVNSYHNLGINNLGEGLVVTGIYEQDNVIKSFEHNSLPIVGIMWHPERNEPFQKIDLHIVQQLFK